MIPNSFQSYLMCTYYVLGTLQRHCRYQDECAFLSVFVELSFWQRRQMTAERDQNLRMVVREQNERSESGSHCPTLGVLKYK